MVLDFKDLVSKYKMNLQGIIHIGGHHGLEAILYKEVNVKKAVFFEPLAKSFNVMKNNIFDYEAINCALGPQEGISEMFIENQNACQSSSLLEPYRHLEFHPAIHFNERQFVQVKTLDSFEFTDYNMINMDVQGYELEVLKGAEKTLSSIEYIIAEVNIVEHYRNGCTIDALDDFLDKRGFIRTDTRFFPELWGDALYVRKTSLGKL